MRSLGGDDVISSVEAVTDVSFGMAVDIGASFGVLVFLTVLPISMLMSISVSKLSFSCLKNVGRLFKLAFFFLLFSLSSFACKVLNRLLALMAA